MASYQSRETMSSIGIKMCFAGTRVWIWLSWWPTRTVNDDPSMLRVAELGFDQIYTVWTTICSLFCPLQSDWKCAAENVSRKNQFEIDPNRYFANISSHQIMGKHWYRCREGLRLNLSVCDHENLWSESYFTLIRALNVKVQGSRREILRNAADSSLTQNDQNTVCSL